MSSRISLLNTTAPADTATFLPSRKAVLSTWAGMALLPTISSRTCFRPSIMLDPFVSMAFFSAPGLPRRVLLGARPSVSSARTKRARSFDMRSRSNLSMNSTSPLRQARWACSQVRYNQFSVHSGSVNRRSPGAGAFCDAPVNTRYSSRTNCTCCSSTRVGCLRDALNTALIVSSTSSGRNPTNGLGPRMTSVALASSWLGSFASFGRHALIDCT